MRFDRVEEGETHLVISKVFALHHFFGTLDDVTFLQRFSKRRIVENAASEFDETRVRRLLETSAVSIGADGQNSPFESDPRDRIHDR